MKRKLEEQIKESDKYNSSTIEAEYDNYDSQEEIIDEELNYKFMNGYNLFYQEDSEKITIVGMKKNLLFYLTSSCSSKDIPMVKTIKARCNDIAWYILECPFFRTEEGRCINVNDCHMMGEMPRQEVNVLKQSKIRSNFMRIKLLLLKH